MTLNKNFHSFEKKIRTLGLYLCLVMKLELHEDDVDGEDVLLRNGVTSWRSRRTSDCTVK